MTDRGRALSSDRQPQPCELVDGRDAGRRRRLPRDPADVHFRRLGQPAPVPVPCRFDVYRADKVSMTSTQFSGGDWHWRLCDEGGRVLVDAGGYRDERVCREAIAFLRERAAAAVVGTSL